jgi:hypothetical protein
LTSAIGEGGARIALDVTASKIASPLEERYWSMAAYRLGDPPNKQAIKFSSRPRPGPGKAVIPTAPTPNFLRETLTKQLKTEQWQFDFEVQPRTSEHMSVENTMVEWLEKIERPIVGRQERDAPFHKVATITILPQDLADLDDFGENL